MATAQNIDSDGLSSLYESILQDYLDEDTDPATTAARYTNPTHQRFSAPKGIEGSLWLMWIALVDLASQTLHESPAHL
jgi:hypothetical protein